MFTYVFFSIAFYFPLLVYTYVKNHYDKMYCTYTIMHSKKRNCSVFKAYFDIDENRGNLASVMRLLHTQRMDLNTEVSFDSNFLKLVKRMSDEDEDEDEDDEHQMIDLFLSRGDIVFRTIDRCGSLDTDIEGEDVRDTTTSSSTDDTGTDSETENEWEAVKDNHAMNCSSSDEKHDESTQILDRLIRDVLERVTGSDSKDECGVEQLLNEAMKMAGEKMVSSLENT